ncbi:predicted protein [Histoplasma capsulatum var. duboisii H88]|uniref:Predicted protein n=1 Tax=Ajellomyces capsulatus (strain H88) TaxID=544711 RepID=F0U8U5_AJEC8|nr:predicted protein [Histoplasma capsulatum var. duboisii H88]
MSYLRLFYQLATQARPSDGHPPRFDGSTVRISRAWEFSRRDGLAFSRGNDGLKLVWLSPEERMAGHCQRNRAITSGRGNRETRDDGTAHTANTGQANGRGGLEGAHTPIRGFRIVGDKSGCVCSCSDSSTDLKIGVSKYPKKGE